MLSEILRSIEMLDSPYYRAEIAICLAEQYNALDRTNDALEYIDRAMQDIALIPVSDESAYFPLCKVAEQLDKAGNRERCLELLAEALQQVTAFEDENERDYGFIDVAEVYAEIGLYDRAIEIGLMLEDDFRAINHLFLPIVYLCVERCDREPIAKIVSAVESKGYKNWILKQTAESYLHRNHLDLALELLNEISSPSTKADVLAAAAEKYRELNQIDRSLALLARAENEILTEENASNKAQSLGFIAERYAALGECDRACQLLINAQREVTSLSAANLLEQIPRDVILSNIAGAFSRVKQYERSLDIANAMSDNIQKGEILSQIAQKSSDPALRQQAIEKLTAAEQAISEEENAHLADLKKVSLTEQWAKIEEMERARSLAESIREPNLKKLALYYTGVHSEEDDDPCLRLSQACASALEQSDRDEGLRKLKEVLESTNAIEKEASRSYLLSQIIKAYFGLLKDRSS